METKDKNENELLKYWREITGHDQFVVMTFIKALAEQQRQELKKQFKVIK